MVDDLPVREISKCINCGDCIKICPVSAMIEARKGWLVRVGGKHGRHPIFAYEVVQFASDEDCYPIIEKTMEWYQAHGEGRERIGAVITRLGLDKYLNEVIEPLKMDTVRTVGRKKKILR